MAMVIRSALAKLASRRNRSGILMLRAFASSAVDNNRNSRSDAVAGHYFRHRSDYGKRQTKNNMLKVNDYYMDLGGVEPARFALEEFNKRKNAQLQLVRVVKAQRHLLRSGMSSLYLITLEAVDDAGVAKLYQTRVYVNFTQGMILEWFCLLVDDGCPVALFDHLEKFFVFKDNEDKADNQIPMCKKQEPHCNHGLCPKLCATKNAYDLPNNGKMLKIFGRWAVKTYNKEKNAQLQYIRVMNGSRSWPTRFVFLTLEAADAGVMKTYLAELIMPIADWIRNPDVRLNFFGHVDDNGRVSVLINKRHEELILKQGQLSELSRWVKPDFCRYKDRNQFIPTDLPRYW